MGWKAFLALALAGAFGVAAPVAAQDAAVLPAPTAADFGALPILTSPLPSPDGKHVVAKGEGHGLTKPENSTDFLTRVGAFLDKYNPANP
jgi:hypothetical protein